MRCVTGVLVLPAAGSPVQLTLPRFANYTESVIALSADQRKQMEYLLLLWLTGTARSFAQISTVGGT